MALASIAVYHEVSLLLNQLMETPYVGGMKVYSNGLVLMKNILSGKPSMSNRVDPDQSQHFVRPDQGSNCLQRLSVDNKNHH